VTVSDEGLLLVAVAMAIGLVGVVVPLLPGLALVWAAGLVWAIAEGEGTTRWVVLALMTVLLVAGTVAKYALPARSATAKGASRSTLVFGALGAIIGFFVIPLVGLLIGGVAGIYLAELVRLGDARRAWSATGAALVAVGLGMLIELAAGVAMVLAWAVGVIVT
jgi:uncharacterized protein YqgC (DUF456 family)